MLASLFISDDQFSRASLFSFWFLSAVLDSQKSFALEAFF
jgi:hypothetical protein